MNVLYRKYRPQKFAELFGQETVKNILNKALESGKFSHAYLFSGSRGVGKTTTARIVAKALNCQENSKRQNFGEPCGQCASCQAIAEGRYLDLIEIDAASNRGIDEIRDLREKIKLAPTEGKYKVYIIDEVHMLTNEAFNALLKTLEEPPSHAIFILCTTDPQKLPLTVVSRCQRFDFKRAAKEDLFSYLGYLGKAEKLNFEEEALDVISQKAEGSYRDAAKMLDQLSTYGQKITLELVNEFFALSGNDSYATLADQLISSDVKAAIFHVNKIFEGGRSLKEFSRGFLEYLRRLLIIKAGVGEDLVKPLVTKEQYEKLESQAQFLTSSRLVRLVDLFTRGEEGLRTAVISQLPLEIAVVEACGESAGKEPVQAVSRKTEAEKVIEKQKQPASKESEEAEKPTPKTAGSEKVEKSDTSHKEDQDEVAVVADSFPNDSNVNLDFIKEHWSSVLKSIKPYNHSLEALLKGCEPTSFNGKILILKSAYRFHKERIEAQKNNELLEKVLSEIIGTTIRVRCLLGEKKINRKLDQEKIKNVVPVNDEDLVKSAADIFNGSLL